MKHIYLLIPVFFIAFCNFTYSQDTLQGSYTDYKIEAGSYLLNESVRFDGSLTIVPGAKIMFADKGAMIIGGSITAVTESLDIEFIGADQNPGNGLVIVNQKDAEIQLQGVVFKNLNTPLFFDNGWYRKKVVITNNHFIENYGKTSLIQILTPYNDFFDKNSSIEFALNENLFAENNSSIFIQDLGSLNLKIDIKNNTFINNKIYGLDSYIISSNLIYGRLDKINSTNVTRIKGNSFIGNYLASNLTGAILRTANLGVYGTQETFDLKDNFFGTVDPNQIANSIYDKKYNYNSPLVEFDPFLKAPSPKTPTHIYSVLNAQGNELNTNITLNQPLEEFTALSNAAIDLSKASLTYIYLKDSLSTEIITKPIAFDYTKTAQGSRITASQKNEILKGKVGYLQLDNIADTNSNLVPKLQIGYLAFGNKKIETQAKIDKIQEELRVLEKQQDSIKKTETKLIEQKLGKMEIGLRSSAVIFRGSISNNNFLENDMNISFGLDFGYTLNSYLTLRLNVSSFTLSNSDLNSGDALKINRGMNFSTTALSVSPGIDFDFIDNRLNSKTNKIRPSLGIGFEAISFNPTGVFDGKEYDLSSLGTGGQQLNDEIEPYSTLTFGLYLAMKIKYQWGKYSIGVFASYHSTFTEYLDDVGSDPYPDAQALYDSNGNEGAAAVYFSNPTSINTNGKLRSDPSSGNDSFLKFGIMISRKLFNPKN
ncbi:DUF6089 family protein [Flavobacteriaceae bacterium]|nr:DUF6089 family protein [Flavobacteriaceae bacterium]